MEEISCPVCFNVFLATSALADRKPLIICENGHTVCAECHTHLTSCPTCRGDKLPVAIINRALLNLIDVYSKALSRVPEIDIKEIVMSQEPFASGAFADVFSAKWHNQDVVVKALRALPEIDKQMKELQLEANLAIGLHHPNIIRLFGTTKLQGNRCQKLVISQYILSC